MSDDPFSDDPPGAPARLLWTESGAPLSARYDDVYFSKADGLAESRHVFQEGTGFAERLSAAEDAPVRLGEIGFGMGLNFLAAWATLRAVNTARAAAGRAPARLDYAGFEQSPPGAEAIRRALAPWPELTADRDALLADWPPAPGRSRRALDNTLTLSLLIGPAQTWIDQLETPREIWWLDGFSPAKNPEAWSEPLLRAIHARAAPGAALATYAAAGWVRRGLQAAGFDVVRRPGFGFKKEMLAAMRRPD